MVVTELMLAHNVFFSLRDKTPQASKQLIEACKKYLAGHPGTVFFATGMLAQGLNRPVNDRDFDVSLHLIFTNKEAHDRYQESALHLQFVAECKEGWAKVRVFDAEVER